MFVVEEFDYRYGGSMGRYYYKNIENARKRFYEILSDFFEEYPDTEIENFYTDSLNDQPLIDISKNAYLVKGDKITKIK